VIVIIGDFTAMIGDPSGKNATRPPLSEAQVQAHAQTYKKQIFKILDESKTTIKFNSEWLNQLSPQEMIALASKTTVARMLERDDFHKRYQSGRAIAVHEFLYPLMQGYDSVALDVDIELGGTDQKFNLLLGRELQKHYGQRSQLILTTPLLEGLDGVEKMSKSLNNYIAVNDSPNDIFGKVMSISDSLMWRYFELLSFRPLEDIQNLHQQVKEGTNPRDIKIKLAEEIVARFHGEEAAHKAQQYFIDYFQRKKLPEEIAQYQLTINETSAALSYILKELQFVKSSSEAIRLIKQGAIKIDGEKINDPKAVISEGTNHFYQIGKKRFAYIEVERGQ
jgi:tyrosyl-tRNA synthetase